MDSTPTAESVSQRRAAATVQSCERRCWPNSVGVAFGVVTTTSERCRWITYTAMVERNAKRFATRGCTTSACSRTRRAGINCCARTATRSRRRSEARRPVVGRSRSRRTDRRPDVRHHRARRRVGRVPLRRRHRVADHRPMQSVRLVRSRGWCRIPAVDHLARRARAARRVYRHACPARLAGAPRGSTVLAGLCAGG